MQIERKEIGVLLIILFLIMAIAFGIGLLSYDKVKFSLNKKLTAVEIDESNCNSLNLFDTAYCLRDEVSGYYKYNITNLGKKLTVEELKQVGGVCQHYAEMYHSRVKELGFNSQIVTIDINDTVSHAYEVMSNDEGYCSLDQNAVECFKFGGGK